MAIDSVLRVTALLVATTGALLVAVGLLRLHEVMSAEARFDDKVIARLRGVRIYSIVGIVLLSVSAVLSLAAEVVVVV